MSGWRSRRFQAYAVVTAFAALCFVLAPAPAPLPKLEAGGGDMPAQAKFFGQDAPQAGGDQEIVSQTQNEAAAPAQAPGDDLRDAVAAGPAMTAGAGHFTTMWISEAGRAPAAQISWQAAAKAAAAPGSKTRGENARQSARPERAASPMDREKFKPAFGAARSNPASLRVAADKAKEAVAASGRGQSPRQESGGRAERGRSQDRSSAGGGLWRAARLTGVSSGHESRSKEKDDKDKEEKSKQAPKHRPFLRRKRLGAPKPPKISKVPSKNPWAEPAPKTLEDGRELVPVPPKTLAEVEAITPPEGKTDHLPSAHWHVDATEQYYHDGKTWGREADGRWTWLEHTSGHWWLWVNPGDPPLLWHEDHWWWQSRGTWFVLHDGDAWVYRYINDWQQEGLTHQDGSQMVYSPDGGEVGVLEPGKGARFYDSESGKSMGTLAENQLPERNRPNVPAQLSLPQ